MLRISAFICIFLTILSMYGFSDEQDCLCPIESLACAETLERDNTLNIKVGYFIFSDAKMRKIYNKGGLDVQISRSFPLWKWLYAYGSVEYLSRHGKSLNGHQKTKIWEVPLSLGLKAIIPFCQEIQYYLTLGPRYFFVHVHNRSSYVSRNLNKNDLGGFVNMGLNFFPCQNLQVDVFGEYSYGRLHFHSSKTHSYGRSVQIGGFTFGAGLGYAF